MGYSEIVCSDFVKISSKTLEGRRICGSGALRTSIIVNENVAEVHYEVSSFRDVSGRNFRLKFQQIPKEIA